MSYDELELDLVGDRKTALFVIISDTDDTFNFIVSIMYTQLFNLLCDRGSQRSYGMNYQKTGKELMSQDEIAVMDGGKCILQVRGVRPFFSNKYDICKHKNYKYLSDYDKKNIFDIEKYLSTNLILKPEDEVELYQM